MFNTYYPDVYVLDKSQKTATVNPYIARLLNSIFLEGILLKAGNINIEPYEKTARVRYRKNGRLYEKMGFSMDMYPAITTMLKLMSGMSIAENSIPQEGVITVFVNDSEYHFNISTLPVVFGEKFVVQCDL